MNFYNINFKNNVQMVNKLTQISKSLIDHVYTKKSLKRNHDAVRIITEKTANDFCTIQLNLI